MNTIDICISSILGANFANAVLTYAERIDRLSFLDGLSFFRTFMNSGHLTNFVRICILCTRLLINCIELPFQEKEIMYLSFNFEVTFQPLR